MPRDIMQTYAAQELYKREWNYHVEMKMWFKRRNPEDMNKDDSSDNENRQYTYFDISNWEQKVFDASNKGNLSSGFLSESDVKIRSSNKD